MRTVSIQRGDFLAGAFIFLASLAASIFLDELLFISVPFVLLFLYAGWLQPKFIFLLLLFVLPFSFEYEFNNGLATDIPGEGLMLMLSFLLLAGLAFHPGSISRDQAIHPLMIILGCWVCWIGVSALLSGQPMISFKFLLAKTWYIGAFVLSLLIWGRDERFLKRAVITLVIATLIAMTWVLLRHWQLGFSFATVNEAVKPFFRNHVNYSAMLVCMFPLLTAVFRLTQSRNLKILAAALMILLVFALFVAYARGAWLALMAGIAADWMIRKKLVIHFFVLSILIVAIGFLWLKKDDRYLQYAPHYQTTIFHEDFKEHLVATYKLKDISTAERFYRWIAGLRMLADRPLTGSGPNTFYDEYKPYAIPAYKTWVSDNPERSGVHNYYLLVAIEQGVPGLVLFLLLAAAMLYYSQKIFHHSMNPLHKNIAIAAGVIIVMILCLNFLSDLIETDKVGSLFFLCIGILVAIDKRSDPRPDVKRVA